jgi:hypothetical protein
MMQAGQQAKKDEAPTETANAVVGGESELMKNMLTMMQQMQAQMVTLQQQQGRQTSGGENAHPNVPDGPACKHCGKKHPLIANHWLGSEAECPGRDWPNNIKDHKAEKVKWFIDRMNARTGKNFQRPAGL